MSMSNTEKTVKDIRADRTLHSKAAPFAGRPGLRLYAWLVLLCTEGPDGCDPGQFLTNYHAGVRMTLCMVRV
jgi:hypothetical protein